MRTGGSHFLFNNKTSIHNRESDRSENPAMQHGLNEETVIYEKIEMLRCRLKRRARFFFAEAKKNSPYCPPSSVVCPLNTEPFVTVLTLGMGNETMNGTFAEGNYELAKFRDSNKAQRHVNELGMRTGAEMYANDAVLDKVVTTTLAVTGIVGAILTFTPFAPIGVGLMAISAIGTTGWKSFRGAYEGGAAGMAAGVVSGIANSALDYATEGVVGVNLSYSYANGFRKREVSIGTDNKTQLGGSIGLNYNAKSGSWGATAGLKVGLGGTDSQGNYSNWVDAGVHVNNIGRESQSQGVSANIRGQYNEKKGLNGSLGLSYDTKAGYGATIGLTSSLGPVNVTPSWTVSEYGGLSSDVQYGFNRNLFNRTNNPDHSAANRNLLSDIFDGLSGLVSGVGRGAQSAWDGMAGAVGGLNGENLSNGWNAIKNALFGGGDDASTVKPGPRPGTYVDEDGTVLVRDPKTGNLAPEWLVPNLVLTDGTLDNIQPNNVPWYKSLMNKVMNWIDPVRPIAAAFGKARRAVLDNPTGLGTEDVEKAAAISADTRKASASAKVAALLADAIESGDKYMLGNLNEFLELKTGQSNLLESVVRVNIESPKNSETMEIFSNLRPETIQKLNRMDWNDLAQQWSNFSGRNLNEIIERSILPYRAKTMNFNSMILSGSWEYLEGANTTITIEDATPQRFRYY
ncbi:hypothetical protein LEP1GSC133_3623 [Leptospira borgpetersenii serovar Pomona str. 200901868]|uniref:Uncharacterized protein n=1 Tax=Leptospira borgpetersenii serovar Pomona str. 200901868 TaxID=1192866 RepID=M6WAP7_LEPBO|nr:hypothetical protein LEP1GSC133_3623 [Leptospira borgpetersenii serovar Pomona str. 200901868]